MEEPNGDTEESRRSDGSSPDPRVSVVGHPEENHETKTEGRQDRTYEGEDEIERTLHCLWGFVKRTFRDAKPGERLNAWLTLALIVCALATAFIYWLQLSKMGEATRAASSAADAAQKTLRQSIAAFRIDERAWVEIGRIDMTAYPAHPPFGISFKYAFFLQNFGKTIAKSVRIQFVDLVPQGDSLGNDQKAINMFQSKTYRQNGTKQIGTFPEEPGPQTLSPGGISPVPVFDDGQAPKQWPTGGVDFSFILGRIDYIDAFGVPHWKKFCYMVTNSRGELAHCNYGNDEDDNPEPVP